MKSKIEAVIIPQVPVQVKIQDENGIEAGYCIATTDLDENKKRIATLWHIYVAKRMERKGYARQLIDFLKSKNDAIKTGATTKEGWYLLKATGFVMQADGVTWEWTK
jgi:GNAT superfamily N-acetyltransferase